MSVTEFKRNSFLISTDKSKLNINTIHQYLSERSYWAQGRSLETVGRSIEHSLCFGVYAGAELVGFARVVTDYATFAWLADVFILESHRGQGLSKWLVECITTYPGLPNLKIFILATRDAQELYRRYGGFELLENPERWMMRPIPT